MNAALIITIATLVALGLTTCAPPEGKQGIPGPRGEQGVPGLQGPRGSDGTQITVVKLCPGATSYPNVFVEVAMCIDSKLYAVYSANNGFLTYLPPGRYQSNAIGSACSFTVGAGCEVVP